MILEQGEVIDEIITKIRAGRITRRTFLERAVAVGLSSSAAVSLLEACGGTSNSTGGNGQTVNINYLEKDTNGVYAGLVKKFNAQNNGVHVTYNNNAPATTDQLLTILTTMLRARGSSIDVFPMDIIWPAEFGANGWTVPLDDKWPASERANYLPGPLKGCTYNGKLWAAPYRTDVGLIYYRTDVISTPPNTWDDLTNMAKAASPSKTKFGYVWQGAQYEGLVCDFCEVLYGYGGNVLDPNDPKKVTVNTPEAVQALTQMVSWVGTISPAAVTTYQETQALAAWQNGDAAFMRNWPYAIALSNDPSSSKIPNKFDEHPMLYGGSNTTGHSNIGGWQYGINAFSKNPDAAWKFIHYMLSPEPQKTFALELSLLSCLTSIYTDKDVLAKYPFFSKMQSIVQTGLPRPVSPVYPDISQAIQLRVHSALTKQASPADALSALQSDLETVVNKQ
ncbi:MAG TPA: ABC transporter substrate-binding protein [Ktedonobacteraceae bacterium]|jgi:multiple sugar transport system substrate-binding protein|nr:ABC transporter substrate-binding protein [Ktedonobacteraceae bacterium]